MSEFFDNYFNIKKMIESKREYRQQMARVEALPKDYQYVFKKIQGHMWMFAAGSGYDMMEIHSGLIELFEAGAADGKHVLELPAKTWPRSATSFCAAPEHTRKTGANRSTAIY
jgi:DNA-binding ferritin-like protein (Dps family)